MSFYYNSNYEYNKNIPNYQSCYYLNLDGYTNSNFGQVSFTPPLSKAITYRDVFYAPPNYNTLQVKKVKSENLNYNYNSFGNAYDACQDCNYSIEKKCPNYSNQCVNNQ
jgi:hypothetical protein